MSTSGQTALLEALKVLETREGPSALLDLANRLSEDPFGNDDLVAWLDMAAPGDVLLMTLGRLLARWDGMEAADWIEGTSPNTKSRRDLIYLHLRFDDAISERVTRLRPLVEKGVTVVSEPFERWLNPSRFSLEGFYWPRYRDYLLEQKRWSLDTVTSIDVASNAVLERLADPLDGVARSQRGLVMGYVQSGKTASLSAVIAKAIDVGYRFIIVMTGVHDALRRQTQRRLDMEVIGAPNIHDEEYLDDPAWLRGEFTDLGGDLPVPEIQRLTNAKTDFNKHQTHALHFKPNMQLGKLYERNNLLATPARIAIVKKNSAVLRHLLTAMKANPTSMLEVPAIVIDDESDQASINTTKPTWRRSAESNNEIIQRKAINKAISSILSAMPRCQYIGYTATPFANVFVDPDDAEDIFPKDFIISLPEPIGYMGSSSFFNSVQPSDSPFDLDNKRAYIRELKASDKDEVTQEGELLKALAAFVVSGAVKLYRAERSPSLGSDYRHHTMLVHEAAQTVKHRELADRIVDLWRNADWLSSSGSDLLQEAFEDYRPTLEDRADPLAPFVQDFELIRPYLSEVISRIEQRSDSFKRDASNVVLVVNSDPEVSSQLDFASGSTWKIIVGGAMLSRGFTIEGLTVSYFRRSPRAHDTLLQMGRWFGFRPGYRDLVRIYLAANTAITRTQVVNLYDAFDTMAETEEAFREQLAQYARWDGDSPAITPKQVVPLVVQALPWLKPTATNKMYNARIVSQREKVFSPKGPAFAEDAVARNWRISEELLRQSDQHIDINRERPGARHVPAECGIVSTATVTRVLGQLEYLPDHFEVVVRPKVAYYQDCEIRGLLSDFLVLFPQLVKGGDSRSVLEIPGLGMRTLARRSRNAKEEYGELTDPEHRDVALAFVGTTDLNCPAELSHLWRPTRGVILAYVIPERGAPPADDRIPSTGPTPEQCTVGLTIYLPQSALDPSKTSRVTWQTTSESAVG